MNTEFQSAEKAKHEFLILHVRYLGAHRPFVDDGAPRTETLAELKPRVLEFFKLTEGGGQHGGKIYTFAHAGKPLTDLSATLGHIAEVSNELKLDLVEQFEQG
jgi:hypothetical protein